MTSAPWNRRRVRHVLPGMPTFARPAVLLLTAALLLTSACANTDDAAQPAAPGASVPPGALVLRVDYTGGFVAPATVATRLPMISVYADGRVITEGPVTLQYPGNALPNVLLRQIEPAAVEQLVERARSAGVRNGADLGRPGITDVPTTRFTLLTEEGLQTTEAYALSEAAGADTGLTEGQVRDRLLLTELITALQDLPATLGADRAGDEVAYRPAEIAAVAGPWQPDETVRDAPEIAWPGPELPGTSLGDGLDLGCVTATGQAAADVLTAAATATAITPWTSAGKKWTVHLRPLLPDEHTCADLTARS
ncbi:hypothetical protein J2S43_002757 [Catenuloplanes nepalensis]|uniref:Secreted protein n=1 Tax=Catenuloplanes nepalensis TaxID=587533 RepID=A0ABT9MS51_9ACTN|nr:hypothetical protein [Catenuloplanes nepalensis]MDP9794245.1 hypothetical protein [Catenuloplanes nepalensis]